MRAFLCILNLTNVVEHRRENLAEAKRPVCQSGNPCLTIRGATKTSNFYEEPSTPRTPSEGGQRLSGEEHDLYRSLCLLILEDPLPFVGFSKRLRHSLDTKPRHRVSQNRPILADQRKSPHQRNRSYGDPFPLFSLGAEPVACGFLSSVAPSGSRYKPSNLLFTTFFKVKSTLAIACNQPKLSL